MNRSVSNDNNIDSIYRWFLYDSWQPAIYCQISISYSEYPHFSTFLTFRISHQPNCDPFTRSVTYTHINLLRCDSKHVRTSYSVCSALQQAFTTSHLYFYPLPTVIRPLRKSKRSFATESILTSVLPFLRPLHRSAPLRSAAIWHHSAEMRHLFNTLIAAMHHSHNTLNTLQSEKL